MSREHRPAGPARRCERGTSTLEVAGLAPIVLVVAFALVHVALALYGITAAQTAARQAARAASLGDDPSAAAAAALPGWLPPTVSTFGPGHGVAVQVDLPDLVPWAELAVTRDAVLP